MDYSGPPDGNLETVFAQYDAIRSAHHIHDTDDHPPWKPVNDEPPAPPPSAEPPSSSTPAKTDLPNPGYKQKTWGDIRADKEENAQQLLEQRLQESRQPDKQTLKQNDVIEQNMHQGHAHKLLDDKIKYPNGGVSYKQDEVGLTKAYNDVSYPGVYYDEGTRTMYVKGTTNAQDWSDDAF